MPISDATRNVRILEPATDVGRTVPRQIDETLGMYQRGGFQRNQKDKASRDSFAVKLTNVVGNHEARYGFDVEVNDYTADLGRNLVPLLRPVPGVCLVPFRSGGTSSRVREERPTLRFSPRTTGAWPRT